MFNNKNQIQRFQKFQKFAMVSLYISLCISFVGCATSKTEQISKTPALTDANIAAIVVGANNIDISAGKIAIQRSSNEAVKKFANRMIVDHKSVLASAVQLVTQLGVTPVNNDLAQMILVRKDLECLVNEGFFSLVLIAPYLFLFNTVQDRAMVFVASAEIDKQL